MSAALEFRNLTLGYDRHPAVHHLHGQIASGALMAPWSERRLRRRLSNRR